MMTTYSKHVADWEGDAYGPFVSVPQVQRDSYKTTWTYSPLVSLHSKELLNMLLTRAACMHSLTQPSMRLWRHGPEVQHSEKPCIAYRNP